MLSVSPGEHEPREGERETTGHPETRLDQLEGAGSSALWSHPPWRRPSGSRWRRQRRRPRPPRTVAPPTRSSLGTRSPVRRPWRRASRRRTTRSTNLAMYAMTHLAIHDARQLHRPKVRVLRVPRRRRTVRLAGSRPWPPPPHDVLVPVIAGRCPTSSRPRASTRRRRGRGGVLTTPLAAIPDGSAKRGIALGQAAAAAIIAPPVRRRLGHADASTRTTHRVTSRASTGSPPARRSRSHRAGGRHPVRAARLGPVPAPPAVPSHQRPVHP